MRYIHPITTSLLTFLFTTTIVMATAPGFYLGMEAGQTKLYNGSRDIQTVTTPPVVSAKPSNTGIGGRVFMGNNINPYFAFEAGLAHYAPSTYSPEPSALTNKPTIRVSSFDFEGKGMIPLANASFFAKAGIAVAVQGLSGSMQSLDPTTKNNTSNFFFRPLLGAGVSYDFTPNWQVSLSDTRILKGSDFASANMMSIGISYHFVDLYCGQFLCN